jgi:hypothetical protein
MTAEPWLHEIKHGITPTISFECDYCATTRRKRDISCWHFATCRMTFQMFAIVFSSEALVAESVGFDRADFVPTAFNASAAVDGFCVARAIDKCRTANLAVGHSRALA